jgi:hypothetical protein
MFSVGENKKTPKKTGRVRTKLAASEDSPDWQRERSPSQAGLLQDKDDLLQHITVHVCSIAFNQEQSAVQNAGIFVVFFRSVAIRNIQSASFLRARIGEADCLSATATAISVHEFS